MTKKVSKKTQEKRSSLKTFVKVVNYNHIMPTRYALDVDLKTIVTTDTVGPKNATKRVEACKAAKQVLQERFKSGKNRWFFSKLRF